MILGALWASIFDHFGLMLAWCWPGDGLVLAWRWPGVGLVLAWPTLGQNDRKWKPKGLPKSLKALKIMSWKQGLKKVPKKCEN